MAKVTKRRRRRRRPAKKDQVRPLISPFDPNGSYTGTPSDEILISQPQKPTQDADDL